jgi:putative ABC transport system substrate-binding protein
MTKSTKVFSRLQSALLSGLIILFTLTQPTAAQQTDKIHRVGILSNAPQTNKALEERLNQFVDELGLLGYVTGRNVEFYVRHPSSMANRAVEEPILAKELVALKPDVIFTFSSPASDAVHRATRTIPVVVAVSVDRFVKNISRPEGNITGLSSQQKDVIGKQLQVFREALPGMKKIGVLWEPTHQAHSAVVKEARRAAQVLGVTLVVVPAANPASFGPAFEKMKDQNVDGVLILRGGLFVNSRPTLSNLANKSRIPSMFGHPSEARAGGLMAYGTNVEALFRRAAHYVDKILKGASPSDLPVEQPTKFDLVINLKTAKKLGISIPPTLMVQANEVIE